MENKEFTIVLCDDKEFRKLYKKAKNIEIVNYSEIMAKLESNDIYKNKPNSKILKFHIVSKLKKSIESQKIETIFYRVDSIDHELMETIKLVLGTYYDKLVLNLILHEDVYVEDIKDRFAEILKVR